MDRAGLWLDTRPAGELLILDSYPRPRAEPQPEIEARFAIVQRLVVAVRQLRATGRHSRRSSTGITTVCSGCRSE